MAELRVSIDPKFLVGSVTRQGQPVTVSVVVPLDASPNGFLAVVHFVAANGTVESSGFEVQYAELEKLDVPALDRWIMERTALLPPPQQAPPGGLTVRKLRGVRLGEIHAIARAELDHLSTNQILADFIGQGWADRLPNQSGPKGKGDRYYADLAADYHRLVNVERNTTPVATLAADRHLAESTIRNRLFTARERGFLTSAGKGRVGGSLTEKARRIRATKGD